MCLAKAKDLLKASMGYVMCPTKLIDLLKKSDISYVTKLMSLIKESLRIFHMLQQL